MIILRLLSAEPPRYPGGEVTYLAEVAEPLTEAARERLVPWTGQLVDDPLRLAWASPGGPAADLEWASAVLRDLGLERLGPAEQDRTWNLSSIWRLPLRDGSAWLKVVPPFFAHEGDILRLLQGAPVPRVLGHAGNRTLLADVPGPDRYDADLPDLLEMVTLLVALQSAWIGRTDELLEIGLPDSRGRTLAPALAGLVERRVAELAPGDRAALETFVADLPSRFAASRPVVSPTRSSTATFTPETFVARRARWSCSTGATPAVGHPMLDMSAFLDQTPSTAVI